MNKKGKSFKNGLICGVLLMVLIFSIGACGFGYVYGKAASSGNWAQIQTKLQLLNRYIEQYYLFDYTEEDIENGIYSGMINSLGDVYTSYYTPEEYASFMESTNGNYCGIGVVVSQAYDTGIISVVQVFENTPAIEAGMQAGDILYIVEGEEVTGKDLNLVVSELKGEEGKEVSLSVLRGEEVIDMKLVRRKVEVPTVDYTMVSDNLGYIQISQFDEVTDDQFSTALAALKLEGMENLIIDLRDNGGGLVDVTCNILDELLPEGLIVYTEDKYGNREEVLSDAEHYFSGELVVLINGNSASASEIFAGAIQDYGIGTLIGTQTYGKGIVQSLFPLNDGSAVKITISRYYTPSGKNIHGVGISPDIEIVYDKEAELDNQLQKAIEVLSN